MRLNKLSTYRHGTSCSKELSLVRMDLLVIGHSCPTVGYTMSIGYFVIMHVPSRYTRFCCCVKHVWEIFAKILQSEKYFTTVKFTAVKYFPMCTFLWVWNCEFICARICLYSQTRKKKCTQENIYTISVAIPVNNLGARFHGCALVTHLRYHT